MLFWFVEFVAANVKVNVIAGVNVVVCDVAICCNCVAVPIVVAVAAAVVLAFAVILHEGACSFDYLVVAEVMHVIMAYDGICPRMCHACSVVI